MGISALALCVAASLSCQGAVAQEPGSRSEWVYSLDLESARAIGWSSPESSPADILRVAVGLLERRLGALDEGVSVEPPASEARIVVRSTAPLGEDRARRLDSLVRSIGLAEFAIVAELDASDGDLRSSDGSTLERMDLRSEHERLDAWKRSHPGKPLVEFDLLPFEDGGPHPRLLWLPMPGEGTAPERAAPILLPTSFEQAFGAADFERAYPAKDNIGYPAIGFALKATRRSEFREFTREYKARVIAIVLNEQVVSAPHIEEELPGEGIIRGRSTQEEVDAAIRRIQALEGPFRPSS
jgi:hypothetical protein